MLQSLDYVVIVLYLLIVAAIGFWASRGQRNTEDYFLGGHKIPWWAAGLSLIATATSALTFMGAPIQSLKGDWTYLQLSFGGIIGYFLVAHLIIGVYYKAKVFTVYGYLNQRFGPLTRNMSGILFFIGRSLGSGVRLYGAAIALNVLAGIDFYLAIAAISIVAVLYTIAGGIKSVIWTDVIQGLLLFGGGVIALFYLAGSVEGGFWGGIEKVAAGTWAPDSAHPDFLVSKLRIFDFSSNPFKTSYSFIGGVIGTIFMTMAMFGTDQDMIQRTLTCKDSKDGKRSIWMSALLNIPIVILFLLVGSFLWLKLGGDQGAAKVAELLANKAGEADPGKGYDYIFPYYVLTHLPAGIKGMIMVGLFAAAMSSLDSAIAALSSTAVKNFWEPYFDRGKDEAHYLKVSRLFAVVFGLILTIVAVGVYWSKSSGNAREGFGVLMLGLKVLSWIFPPLLGIVLLGILTRRGSDWGNILAFSLGIAILLYVEFGMTPDQRPWAWVWNSVFGTLISFGVGALFRQPQRTSPAEVEG
ncbi:MAG TPA: hypothetical protein ENK02_15545 [Planctomycetes bacterium]|nr:hypothetical protein [Planctomycetota bacterium]